MANDKNLIALKASALHAIRKVLEGADVFHVTSIEFDERSSERTSTTLIIKLGETQIIVTHAKPKEHPNDQ